MPKEWGITRTDCACAYPSAHDLIFRVLRCAGHLTFVEDFLCRIYDDNTVAIKGAGTIRRHFRRQEV